MRDDFEHKSDKSTLIVEAAVAEFLENGFADASMDRISARAEVSKRTVYKHFESKDNLFRELIRRLFAQVTATLDISYDRNRSIREQLLELATAKGRLLTSEEGMKMTRLVMSEMLRRPELVEETQEKTDYKAAFETMLRLAAEDGKLRIEDPHAAAEEFLALIKGQAFWPVVFGAPVVSEDEMARIIASSVDMMMSRYGT